MQILDNFIRRKIGYWRHKIRNATWISSTYLSILCMVAAITRVPNRCRFFLQAIKWLNELYAVLMKSHSHIGSTVREILSQKEEHERFQETAKVGITTSRPMPDTSYNY